LRNSSSFSEYVLVSPEVIKPHIFLLFCIMRQKCPYINIIIFKK
jgi:hypothetical protein